MPLLRAHKPRHAKPSKAAPVLAVGGLTATFGAATATAADAATAQDFARLRACESGGVYSTNTGNGYYGAYQFDVRTWQGLGYSGLPSSASPSAQDSAARALQSQRGWQPWPACARRLGLGGGSSPSVSASSSRSGDEVRASRSSRRVSLARTPRPTLAPTTAPVWEGDLLTADLVKQNRADVRRWQHRMAARGWDISVDGRFGPKSAQVAARFAAEKGFTATPGTVDGTVWDAAWEMPLS